jgi:hypothetical protein
VHLCFEGHLGDDACGPVARAENWRGFVCWAPCDSMPRVARTMGARDQGSTVLVVDGSALRPGPVLSCEPAPLGPGAVSRCAPILATDARAVLSWDDQPHLTNP